MKRMLWVLAPLAVAGLWLVAQNATTPRPLADIAPAGALVVLEARDLAALLGDWNNSAEKTTWLGTENYQVFARSRLYLRLQQVFDEYAAGVGVAPDLVLLNSIAGRESALAIYDINQLEALYVTRLPAARAMQSVLWTMREKFNARSAAGQTYYTRTHGPSRRTAAFAVVGDLLLVATREQALLGALARLGGAANAPGAAGGEPWFDQVVRAGGAPQGVLRLVMNLEKLVAAPAFRSYWIQGNVASLRDYTAGISDVERSAGQIHERRALLRSEPAPVPDSAAVGALLRLVATPGLYRAWAQPDPEFVAGLLGRKILHPGPATGVESRNAPGASIEAAQMGEESDLDTRLGDGLYDPPGAVYKHAAIEALVRGNAPRAMLQLQSSRLLADRVFVTSDAVIAIEGTRPWDAAAVKEALTAAVEGLHTTARLGLTFRPVANGIEEMDGLTAVGVAIRGNLLLVATRADALAPVLARVNAAPVAQPGVYMAGYQLAAEAQPYGRLMRLIDFPQAASRGDEPALFSQNLPGLLRTLERVRSVAIAHTDDGRILRQSVRYQMAP